MLSLTDWLFIEVPLIAIWIPLMVKAWPVLRQAREITNPDFVNAKIGELGQTLFRIWRATKGKDAQMANYEARQAGAIEFKGQFPIVSSIVDWTEPLYSAFGISKAKALDFVKSNPALMNMVEKNAMSAIQNYAKSVAPQGAIGEVAKSPEPDNAERAYPWLRK